MKRISTSLKHTTLAALVMSAGFFMPTGLAAADDETPMSAEQALADDVTQASVDLNQAEDSLSARAEGQDEFNELAASIRQAAPRHFVQAYWDGQGSSKTRIYVHGEALTQAQELAGDRAAYVAESSAISEESRVAAESALVEAAVSLTRGEKTISAAVDPATLEAVVTIEAPAGQRYDASRTRAHAKTLAAASPDLANVRIEYSASPAQAEYGSGGNWNGASCTAGFTATRDGKPAISGTSHCGPAATYDGATLSGRLTSSAIAGDVQSLIATGGTRTNLVRYDWGKSRAITSAFDPQPGNVVCHFGVTSGQRCSQVTAVGKTTHFPGLGTVGNLVFVRDNVSRPGDSGGPWFWANRAHGIHMGNCGGFSCFSAISSLDAIRTVVFTGWSSQRS